MNLVSKMKKLILGAAFAMALALPLSLGSSMKAEAAVTESDITKQIGNYNVWVPKGVEKPSAYSSTNVTKITTTTLSNKNYKLDAGWYVVDGDVDTSDKVISITGDVNIILNSGTWSVKQLYAYDGYRDYTIAIWTTDGGTGELNVNNPDGNGIFAGGMIFYGGTVTATSSKSDCYGLKCNSGNPVMYAGTFIANGSNGIFTNSYVGVDRGLLVANGSEGYGLYADLHMTGGTVIATGATKAENRTNRNYHEISGSPTVKAGDSSSTASTITSNYLDGIKDKKYFSITYSSIESVTSVALDKTTLKLTVGASQELTATVAPATATNKTATWTSSNTSVATVDQTGKVTAVAAGTATITVETMDANKTATCAVAVRAKHTCTTTDHVTDAEVLTNDIVASNSGYMTGGNYYLDDDLVLSQNINIWSGTVNLCLNGHVLKGNQYSAVITVYNNAVLNIYDCNPNTSHTFTPDSDGVWVFKDDNSGTKTVKGGCITGGKGGIGFDTNVNSRPKAVIYGGNIIGNKQTSTGGGGISISSGATVTIYSDGKIIGNYGTYSSGGIDNSGTLVINGGTISENTTGSSGISGGILFGKGTITLSGSPIIKGNKKGTSDNNLYLNSGKTLTIGSGFESTASIGITTAGAAEIATSTTDYSSSFAADDFENYKIQYVSQKLKLAAMVKHTCGSENTNKVTNAKELSNSLIDQETGVLAGGSYYLSEDLTLEKGIVVKANTTVNICLNGKVLSGKLDGTKNPPKPLAAVITVEAKGILNIYDCSTSSTHKFTSSDRWVHDDRYGDETVTGGCITGGTVGIDNQGTATLYKGNIVGNGIKSEYKHGGVYNRGVFTIKGGTIIGNCSECGGGIDNAGTLTIDGGTITKNRCNNTATGIYNYEGTLTINGGSITENTGASSIYNGKSGNLVINGGSISNNNNNSGYYGGGIYNEGTLTITGGSIAGNQGYYGGGIFNTGSLTIAGGSITGNKSTYAGGGIYHNGSSFKISGSPTITGNKRNTSDDNVYLSSRKKLTIDGALSNNTSIGITTAYAPTTGAPEAFSEKYTTQNYSDKFVADNSDYKVQYNSASKLELAVVEKHTCTNGDNKVTDAKELTAGGTLEAGSYYLSGDLLATSIDIKAGDTVNLCLNGHVLQGTETSAVITVPSGATLNLYDCGTVEHRFVAQSTGLWTWDDNANSDYESITGGCITNGIQGINNCGTVTIYGGNIVGNQNKNKDSGRGGGIYNEGDLIVRGGSIKGNYVTSMSIKGGAGICNYRNLGSGSSANLTIYGGNIEYNVSNTLKDMYGGGIFNEGGSVTIEGGTVSNNRAPDGGGIANSASGTVTIKGGSIENNTATGGDTSGNASGGGICNYGTLSISGGLIKNNSCDATSYSYGATKTSGGGGIFVGPNSKVTISGGTITENKATRGYGGGIFAYYYATLTIGNASITNNTSVSGGSGVYAVKNITLKFVDAPTISGNKKGGANDNVYLLNNSKITMDSSLSNSTPIGITTDPVPTAAAAVVISSEDNETDYSTYFSSDNDAYLVRYNNKRLELAVHTRTVTLNVNGGAWATGYTQPASYTEGAGLDLPTASNISKVGYTFDGWYSNSTFSGSAVTSIASTDTGNKEYWAKWTHVHGSWNYSVENTSTLKAECGNDGCTDTKHSVSITIGADNQSYTGSAYTGASLGNTSAWTTAGLNVPSIQYQRKKSDGTWDITLNAAPSNVGTYRAFVTVDSKTAEKEFKITAAQIDTVSFDNPATPVAGDTPASSITGVGTGYTGAIAWNSNPTTFAYNTAYKATVTLTADANHTFASDATYPEGWTKDTTNSSADTIVLTKTYAATAKAKITSVTAPSVTTQLTKFYSTAADAIATLPTTVTATAQDGTTSFTIGWVLKSGTTYTGASQGTNTFVWTISNANYEAETGVSLTGEVTLTNPTHVHGSFTFVASGDTLTATCGATACPGSTPYSTTLKINASDATYTGQAISASYGEGVLTNWRQVVANNEDASHFAIQYKEKLANNNYGDVSSTAPVNAGTYVAFLTWNNYTIQKEFTISPKTLAESDVSLNATSFAYTGSAQGPIATVTVGQTTLVKDTDCEVTGDTSKTDCGTDYKITVTGKGNYTGTVNKTWSITPVAATLTTTPVLKTEVTYNKQAQAVLQTAAVANGGTVYYQVNSGDWTTTPSVTDAGTYTISYKIEADKNHTSVNETSIGSFTVAPKTIGISWGGTSFTYNGSAQKPSATATDVESGDTCTITVNGEQTNAGTGYTATASGVSNTNYALPASKTTTFTIDKVSLTLTADNKSKHVGKDDPTFSYSITSGSLVGQEELSGITVSRASGETATTYAITCTEASNANPNYAITTVEGTFTIQAHDPKFQSGQAKTCTADGWKGYYKCSVDSCQKLFSDVDCTNEIVNLDTWKTTDDQGKIPAKNHSWNYKADGAKLTATCANDEDHKVSLTLTVAEDTTYTGNAVTVSYAEGEAAAWKTATGNDAPAIIYKKGDDTVQAPSAVGTYKATATVDGKTADKQFTISTVTIPETGVTLDHDSFVYNGEEQKPTATVKATVNGTETTLTSGTDYDVTCTAQTAKGQYTITITGKNNFVGTVNKNWSIISTPATLDTMPGLAQTATYDKIAKGVIDSAGAATGGTIYYSIGGADDSFKAEVPTVTDAGTYEIYVKVVADDNHSDTTKVKVGDFVVAQKAITITATDASKHVGATDPELAYTITSGELCSGDTLTGITVSRAVGEAVANNYAITCTIDSATANGNYKVTVVDGTFTIKGHTGVKVTGKAATYDADGWKDAYQCSVCKKYFTEEACTNEINYSDWKVSEAANGGKIPALVHSFAAAWSKDDTYHWHADSCETAHEVIQGKAEHTWGEAVVTKEATTEEAGVKTYTCSVCDATKTEAIPKLHAHSAEKQSGQAASCTAVGFKDYYKCSDSACGALFADAECKVAITDLDAWKKADGKLDVIAHTYGEYVPNSDATVDADGTKTRTCSVCGKKDTVTNEGSKLEKGGEIVISEEKESGNFAAAGLENTKEELQTVLLTTEDKNEIAHGKGVSVWTVVANKTENVVAEEKTAIEGKVQGTYQIGSYMEVTLWKQVEGKEPVKVTEVPNGSVKIVMNVPVELRKDGRIYKIARIHDGVVTLLDAVLNANYDLIFETDAFSTYAIAYSDPAAVTETPATDNTAATTTTESAAATEAVSAKPVAPKTGDNNNVFGMIMLMVVASVGMAEAMRYKKRRQ